MPTERPLIPAEEPEWITILREQVGRPGATITSVAAEIDMSRPALSMVLTGSYPARMDRVTRRYAAAVIARYRGAVACPHLRRSLTQAECAQIAGQPLSTSNPERLRQWRACQTCALSPFNATPEAESLRASNGA